MLRPTETGGQKLAERQAPLWLKVEFLGKYEAALWHSSELSASAYGLCDVKTAATARCFDGDAITDEAALGLNPLTERRLDRRKRRRHMEHECEHGEADAVSEGGANLASTDEIAQLAMRLAAFSRGRAYSSFR